MLDTYKGVSGYIYGVKTITDSLFPLQIPDVATSREPTPVAYCEFIPDAYEAILVAEKAGLISIQRYENMGKVQLERCERRVRREYEKAVNQPEYRHFIEGKFSIITG